LHVETLSGAVPISVEQLELITPQLDVLPNEIIVRADKAAKQFNQQGICVKPRRANPSGINKDGLAFLKGAVIFGLLATIFSGK
jgi:hypothetical protein